MSLHCPTLSHHTKCAPQIACNCAFYHERITLTASILISFSPFSSAPLLPLLNSFFLLAVHPSHVCFQRTTLQRIAVPISFSGALKALFPSPRMDLSPCECVAHCVPPSSPSPPQFVPGMGAPQRIAVSFSGRLVALFAEDGRLHVFLSADLSRQIAEFHTKVCSSDGLH